jgi:hypothetical protein
MKQSNLIILQTIISLAIFYFLGVQGLEYYPEYSNYIVIALSLLALRVLVVNIKEFYHLIKS